MDKIYPPSDYKCTERIPLQEYFDECAELYKKHCPSEDFKKRYKSLKTVREKTELILDQCEVFDKKKREEFIECCRYFEEDDDPIDAPSTSKGRPRKKSKEPIVVPEEAKKFHTVRVRMEYHSKLQKKQREDEAYECELKPRKSRKTNIKPGTEFAVSIRIYYPFSPDGASNTFNKLRFSHEIVLLGSNTLADLRDKIMCRADLGLCVEVEHPKDDLSNVPAAKEKYPSGFIFIENVFYNDMRNENAKDYSAVIRDWAKKVNIDPLSTAKMEETKINQLSPRFGYPYVYQHQADCEHIITFSLGWLLTDDADPLNTSDYPYIKSVQRFRTKQCILCYKATAKWICYNSDRLPHAEAFLCQQCVLEYMYKDGKKIGEFKLYPFYDESCPV